jgi:hypothetical protein
MMVDGQRERSQRRLQSFGEAPSQQATNRWRVSAGKARQSGSSGTIATKVSVTVVCAQRLDDSASRADIVRSSIMKPARHSMNNRNLKIERLNPQHRRRDLLSLNLVRQFGILEQRADYLHVVIKFFERHRAVDAHEDE